LLYLLHPFSVETIEKCTGRETLSARKRHVLLLEDGSS
jgi:hypothetical protein